MLRRLAHLLQLMPDVLVSLDLNLDLIARGYSYCMVTHFHHHYNDLLIVNVNCSIPMFDNPLKWNNIISRVSPIRCSGIWFLVTKLKNTPRCWLNGHERFMFESY